MTDELLDRVRAADPLPDNSKAPAFDSVFASFPDVPRRPRRERHRRLVGLLVPMVSVAVAIGVLVLAATVLHARAGRSPDQAPANAGGRSLPAAPRGGMAGVVTVWGAGFNDSGDGVISLQRCLRCRPDGNLTKHSAITDWFLATHDDGRSWSLSRRGYYLQGPNLTGSYGWAGGLQQLTRKEAAGGPAQWEPGAGIARYFVSHDGGGTWSVAPSAAPNEGGSFPSVAGGEAWAVGLGLRVAVLHSRAQGTRLLATTSQPIHGDDTNVQIEGAGNGTAYVVNGDSPGQAFGTRDNGRSWQRLTHPPCTGQHPFTKLIAAFGQTVWLTCIGSAHSPVLVRSLDGGRSWSRLAENWSSYGPGQMVAVSPTVAWALKSGGELVRTTDAGTTWQPVWSATDPHVSPFSRPVTRLTASPLPLISVQSAESASIVTLLNRRARAGSAGLTNLVVYRTNDGGRTWQAHPVHL